MYPRHVTLLTVLTLAVDRTRVTCELSNEVAHHSVENFWKLCSGHWIPFARFFLKYLNRLNIFNWFRCLLFVFLLLFSLWRTLHRTSIYVEGSKPALARETGSKTAAMMDSLIQGLIYERQTGDYFKLFLQKSGNEVIRGLISWRAALALARWMANPLKSSL